MKIRSDYVSNSSSSSFMIAAAGEASKATSMFIEDFAEWISNHPYVDCLGESMSIYLKTTYMESSDSYSALDFVKKVGADGFDIESIESIEFSCDDYDSTAMEFLKFLYEYFVRLGFSPDCSDSERPMSDSSGFMWKVPPGFMWKVVNRFVAIEGGVKC